MYHVAIAVENIAESEQLFEKLVGLKVTHREEVRDQGVKTSMLQPKSGEGTAIELLEPLNNDSPISKFLSKRGEGIHHICFHVDNIESKLEKLKKQGIRLIDEKPRIGAYNSKVAFIHPKSANGVLVELAEFEKEG
ncbi:MAG: methylmalonyl-CoA epimerase [Candidatus Dadabacteria bacterium]|nr:methylmalonyl-CoA epimerase [Candidatus Dadabacteria bacterium]NIQ14177.1 methylmalonyl-CoA epimerase [Candidatus Dadabacteria bacterium]